MDTTALRTDQYELTMLASALADGTAHQPARFEAFTRTGGGLTVGIGRIVAALEAFTFDRDTLDWLADIGVATPAVVDYLDGWTFTGTIRALPEGEHYTAGVPVLTVDTTFGDGLLLETLILSILNHDSAVATNVERIIDAAAGRPVLEMGSRRVHEGAAVAAARAAIIAGATATSNLAAARRWNLPSFGTAAHAWTLAHPSDGGEQAAFATQLDTFGTGTTLLVDTFDIDTGIRRAVAAARDRGANGPGAIRIDSGDLHTEAVAARALLDELGAADTRIVVSSDLDAERIAALIAADAPIDAFGVGTRAVAGLTPPGFVYKLTEIDGVGVAKASSGGKATVPGAKTVWRHTNGTLTATVDGEPAPAGATAALNTVWDTALTSAAWTET